MYGAHPNQARNAQHQGQTGGKKELFTDGKVDGGQYIHGRNSFTLLLHHHNPLRTNLSTTF
jgi:hypothetical protein